MDDEWSEVTYEGTTGWVNSRFLVASGGDAVPTPSVPSLPRDLPTRKRAKKATTQHPKVAPIVVAEAALPEHDEGAGGGEAAIHESAARSHAVESQSTESVRTTVISDHVTPAPRSKSPRLIQKANIRNVLLGGALLNELGNRGKAKATGRKVALGAGLLNEIISR